MFDFTTVNGETVVIVGGSPDRGLPTPYWLRRRDLEMNLRNLWGRPTFLPWTVFYDFFINNVFVDWVTDTRDLTLVYPTVDTNDRHTETWSQIGTTRSVSVTLPLYSSTDVSLSKCSTSSLPPTTVLLFLLLRWTLLTKGGSTKP